MHFDRIAIDGRHLDSRYVEYRPTAIAHRGQSLYLIDEEIANHR